MLIATLLLANSVNSALPQLTDEEKAYFMQQGLPIPDSGVTFTKPSRNLTANKSLMEQRRDGYRHEFSQAATNLLKIDALLSPELKRVEKTTALRRQNSADLTADLNSISLAYIFRPVPNSEVKRLIAYAPTGIYVRDKSAEGWVGVTEYFESYFAPCSYEEVSVPLTGTATIIDKDTVTYEVANKVGEYYATGDSTGYLYQIEWFDAAFRRKLRCATKKFSPHIRPKLIALANKIDLG